MRKDRGSDDRGSDDRALARLAKVCLALPEAIREAFGVHSRFVVRKRTFAYYLNDHHGDGVVGLCVKVAPGANRELIAGDPARYYMPAYLGAQGWVGLRLDTKKIDWDEVGDLVAHSYRRVAPKRLAAQSKG